MTRSSTTPRGARCCCQAVSFARSRKERHQGKKCRADLWLWESQYFSMTTKLLGIFGWNSFGHCACPSKQEVLAYLAPEHYMPVKNPVVMTTNEGKQP